MNRLHSLLLLVGLFAVFGNTHIKAQQTPTSLNMIYRPRLWNPASRGAEDFNKVVLSHQQRHLVIPGWRSTGQFLDFNSHPLGKKGAFGWGVMLNNQIEHTENRFAFSGAMGVSVIKQKQVRLSLGFNAGLINWASNYDSIRVFDRTDELLAVRSNFIEIDAGIGAEFAFRNKFWDIEIGAAGSQLPRNLSTDSTTLSLYPHIIVGGMILAEPIHNLKVGPAFFYKNIFLTDTSIAQNNQGVLDVGLKAELDRQQMWFGLSYRLNRSALNGAFGLQIYCSDSAAHPHKQAIFADINAGMSYPIRQVDVFGPTMEFGLSVYFGREFKYRRSDDTLVFVTGSFWVNDGSVGRHLQEHFLAASPPGTRGSTFVTNKNVTLNYEFPDPSLQYVGTTPDISGDTLFAVGVEWVGVDGFLEGIVHQVIDEALEPDTNRVLNPEVLIALDKLEFLEFSALLKANETEAFYDAEGMVYEGELGVNNGEEDTLFLAVVYNGADTVIGVPLNRYISNLELACLKLHAMTKKVKHELTMRYGDEMLFIMEGDKFDAEEALRKTPVTIRKPRILPNHPHQDVFQVNQVKIKFRKNEGTEIIDTGNGTDEEDEVIILEEEKKPKRGNTGSFRDKRN